jgi:hypothetical protein
VAAACRDRAPLRSAQELGLPAAAARRGLAPRAAIGLAALPRGNQAAVSAVVIRRGLTVRQTERLAAELRERPDDAARAAWIAQQFDPAPVLPGPGPRRALRSEIACSLSRAIRGRACPGDSVTPGPRFTDGFVFAGVRVRPVGRPMRNAEERDRRRGAHAQFAGTQAEALFRPGGSPGQIFVTTRGRF